MKKQLLLLAGLFLLLIFSCKKDRLDLPDDEKAPDIQLALKNLKTEEEQNFFDKNYLIRVNPHLKDTITTRDELDDLTNAVFNFILLKNEESQFVPEMVQKFGYPIWSESVIFPDINNPASKSLVTPFAKATADHISGFLIAMPHGWSSSPIYALLMIDREIIAERVIQQWPDSMNLGFNAALHYHFDKKLFGHIDKDFEDWLKENTPEEGLVEMGVDERTNYNSFSFCREPIAFDDETVEERDCAGTWVTINYFDCDNLFGLGSWMPSGNGSGSSGSSGGGGGGGGGGAAAPTDQQALDNYEYEKCQWYQSLEDGEVTLNQIPGGFNQQQADICNALEQLQFLSIPHQAWLINNPETFGVVATWVLANLPIDSEEAQMLSTYLTLLSSGQTTLPFRDFRSLWVKVRQLQEELNLTLGEVSWLLIEPNSDYAYEVSGYLQNNNLEHQSAAKEASKIYLNLLKNDPEFAELSAEFAAIPSFIWPFIREVAVEVAIELIKKHIPGVSDYNNVINAINNLQQGDMLGFLGEVLDIVKKKFPALAAIDLAIDGYQLTGVAAKAWKAYSKMEQFGGEVIEKFSATLITKAGGILGKIQWQNNSVGAKIFDVGNPQSFVDDFLNLFPNVSGPHFLNPLHPLEQTYYVGSMIIRFYPVSNTTGGPTLSFIGSPDFKIRFP